MSKPSIPQGTRDFSPVEVRKRQYLFNTLRSIFELYGYQPLETPAMENLATLTGKYGEEGDRLIFKIIKNGLNEGKNREALEAAVKKNVTKSSIDLKEISRLIRLSDLEIDIDIMPIMANVSERALRYDLTIPFARYVAMHHQELALPFRRYQMQPVWRADRPQRGRYREFWQCDCDVVGSNSLLNEAELLCIYRSAFHALNVPQITVKINSRKLLAALAEAAGHPELMMDITIALDKIDKIGWSGVVTELQQRGIAEAGIETIRKVIEIQGSNEEKLAALEDVLGEAGKSGIEELRKTLAYHAQLADSAWDSSLVVDISLARGLNYYTGVIVEVTTSAVKMGSIGGGGRYDDLTGLFGVKGLSGVGISFGIDRIYDVLDELKLFPEQLVAGTRVLLINFGGENEAYALKTLQDLRTKGIAAELYPEAAKFDKQMKYADKKGIPFVLLAGDEERKNGVVALKNLSTGVQQSQTVEEAFTALLA